MVDKLVSYYGFRSLNMKSGLICKRLEEVKVHSIKKKNRSTTIKDINVAPDPFGSAFIWVRGSTFQMRFPIRIQRYKIEGKQSLTNKFLGFFVGNYIFQV